MLSDVCGSVFSVQCSVFSVQCSPCRRVGPVFVSLSHYSPELGEKLCGRAGQALDIVNNYKSENISTKQNISIFTR